MKATLKKSPLARACLFVSHVWIFPSSCLFSLLLILALSACSAFAPPAPTPDPRLALETIVAATLQAASGADATATSTATPAPTLTPSPTPVAPEVFEAGLRRALSARDFAALSPLLSEPFTLSLWPSLDASSSTLSASDFVSRLRGELLASKAKIGFAGQPPEGIEAAEPPGLQSPRRIFSSGWGPDGMGEVVLTLGFQSAAEGPEGRLAWRSLVFAPTGFNPPPPASLTGIINVPSANLRSGPSPLHTLVAPYAMGTPMTISYTAPGFRWGRVTAPDGQEGWLLLSLMDLKSPPETLPLYPGTPSDSIPVMGWVEGGSGQPIDKAVVSLWQKQEDTIRPQAFTNQDGMFFLYLPANSTGNWTVGVVSVDCTSSAMDPQCEKQREFVQLTQTITIPPGGLVRVGPLSFVYNNIMGAAPATAAQGCLEAEPGKIPMSNSQDGYCLLYPEGFTIRQPATSVLEIVGPALDQPADDQQSSSEPLMARVIIQKKPLPGGSSLETVAAALWSASRPGFHQSQVTLGEEPALYADHLIIGNDAFQVRKIVVIHKDHYYILTFTPYDDTPPYSTALPDQEKLWTTLTASFRFLP